MGRRRPATEVAEGARVARHEAPPPPSEPPPPPPEPGDWSRGPPAALLAFNEGSGPEEIHGPLRGHPEGADRVSACLARLRSRAELWRALRKVPRRPATDAELLLCHDEAHLAGLRRLSELAGADGKPHFLPSSGPVCLGGPCCEVREGSSSSDTYVTAGSVEAARLSVGGLLQLVDAAAGDGHRRGLALCRPPGHHASRSRSSGFCLVNNVAVAAAYARHTYPEIQRVLILDWDVHHGQGTQQIFEQSSDVMVFNVHRHDGQSFYPATGGASEVGSGPGRGFTVNVPLPQGYGGAALWEVCANVLVPAARRFQPDLFIVSAGFDAAMGDHLGGCQVPPSAFGVLTREMRRLAEELAGGRLILALEGGYATEVLADCVEAVVDALVEAGGEATAAAFAEPQPAGLGGSTCFGAIRRTCEVHHSLPLRLPLPASKAERRGKRSGSSRSPSGVAASPTSGGESARSDSPTAGVAATEASPRDAEDCSAAAPAVAQPAEPRLPSKRRRPRRAQVQAAAGEAPEALAAEPPRARVELSPGEIVLRIAPVPPPCDVAASPEEVWVWSEGQRRRWRLEGVRADTAGAQRCAEFRVRRSELTVRLRLGPILGGAVGVVPIDA